jgi:pyruvate/2-oxoglutarate dehydrogenase complex dihydrolipoamide dehydrogenase (E3) component
MALVDDHLEIGGAGVNTGTVPSKTLRETALACTSHNVQPKCYNHECTK